MNFYQNKSPEQPSGSSFPFGRLSLLLTFLLPYLPPSIRKPLFIFSRIYECMECMKHPEQYGLNSPECANGPGADMQELLAKISPFLDERERSQLEQMQSMLQMLQLYQSFQDIAPMMNSNPDPLFSMLNPEQQAMFQAMNAAMGTADFSDKASGSES